MIHGTASDVEFTMLEALKLLVLETLGAEQVAHDFSHAYRTSFSDSKIWFDKNIIASLEEL